jgi:hypothetical protein
MKAEIPNMYLKYNPMIDSIFESKPKSKLRKRESQVNKMIQKITLTTKSKRRRKSTELIMEKIGKEQNKLRISKPLASDFARGLF